MERRAAQSLDNHLPKTLGRERACHQLRLFGAGAYEILDPMIIAGSLPAIFPHLRIDVCAEGAHILVCEWYNFHAKLSSEMIFPSYPDNSGGLLEIKFYAR
jgi:hypothetical protein